MKYLSVDTMLFLVRLLPRRLVYFCAIKVMAHATQGKYSDNATYLPGMTAVGRYDDDFNVN